MVEKLVLGEIWTGEYLPIFNHNALTSAPSRQDDWSWVQTASQQHKVWQYSICGKTRGGQQCIFYLFWLFFPRSIQTWGSRGTRGEFNPQPFPTNRTLLKVYNRQPPVTLPFWDFLFSRNDASIWRKSHLVTIWYPWESWNLEQKIHLRLYCAVNNDLRSYIVPHFPVLWDLLGLAAFHSVFDLWENQKGSAMYFWLILTIFWGVNTNLGGWEAPEGVNPPW